MSTDVKHIPEAVLRAEVQRFLTGAGASAEDAEQTTRALLHASRIGVDSHGVRLCRYYADLLQAGVMNARPTRVMRRTGPAAGVLDGDDGLAHGASYQAMDEAVDMAATCGIGAVGVVHSTHFGAAGAYAVEAAHRGMIGLVTTNSLSLVSLFGGGIAFHGTNPIAMAAPVPDSRPWLLDMATSSIPFNRVQLYRSLGLSLPEGTAVDAQGHPTTDPARASFLQPLGGPEFGFKGAALAGVVTILSAILPGATLDPDILPDAQARQRREPANIGHFFIAIDPARFVGRTGYDAAITRYLEVLRASPAVDPKRPVMAPGDREWAEAEKRARLGIPVDPDTLKALGL